MTRSPSTNQGTFDDDDEKDARGRRKERPQQLDLIDFSEKTSLVVNDKVSIHLFYAILALPSPVREAMPRVQAVVLTIHNASLRV